MSFQLVSFQAMRDHLGFFIRQKGKGKGKRGFVRRLVVNTPLRRSGMARVLKGSHSFTYTPVFIR